MYSTSVIFLHDFLFCWILFFVVAVLEVLCSRFNFLTIFIISLFVVYTESFDGIDIIFVDIMFSLTVFVEVFLSKMRVDHLFFSDL